MNTGDVALVQPIALEDAHEPALERQAEVLVEGRVLGLGVDADRPVVLLGLALDQVR